MSTLEYIIWNVLGYAAMPMILLIGFVGVAVFSLWALSLTSDKEHPGE